jgi:hypothetical protein
MAQLLRRKKRKKEAVLKEMLLFRKPIVAISAKIPLNTSQRTFVLSVLPIS